jgi:hypothetical protein
VALVAGLGIAALPAAIAVPGILVAGLAGVWAGLRFALPLSDRESLGSVGRTLRLFSAFP